ncbi:SGT1 family transcriptional regulator Sgt1 [Schizosaccharomyces pombe]
MSNLGNNITERIESDCISQNECRIDVYFSEKEKESTEASINMFLAELERLQLEYGKEHIWQNEELNLQRVEYQGKDCILGITNFGDCIDDEWYIVWLLREASKAVKSAFVRIIDEDGEFLLIEAALSLPKWIDEDNSDYRVWIHNGEVIILRPEDEFLKKMNRCPPLTREQAIFQISSGSNLYTSREVNDSISQRLKKFPKAANVKLRAICTVPRKIVHVLQKKKNLISSAVNAFYYRDPIDENYCDRMSKFNQNDLVTTTITFTPLLYAQLYQQRCKTFRPFHLPSDVHSLDYERAILGMKLSCGFEILYNSKENVEKRTEIDEYLQIQPLPTDEDIKKIPLIEDDTSFMNVNPDELEELLEKKLNSFCDDFGDDERSGFDNTDHDNTLVGEEEMVPGNHGGKSINEEITKNKQKQNFNESDLKNMASRIETFINDEASNNHREDFYGVKNSDTDTDSDSLADSDDEIFLNRNQGIDEVEFDETKFYDLLKGKDGKYQNQDVDEFSSGNEDEMDIPGDANMEEYMRAMDEELYGGLRGRDEGLEGIDDKDIDLNLMKNIIEGIEANPDLYGGPISTLLNSLKIQIPREK